jgi:hypothetical protein
VVLPPKLTLHTWLVDGLPPAPEPECWLHPDVEIRRSTIAQHGLFARAAIAPGTVVSRLGGRLVNGAELRQIFNEAAVHLPAALIDAQRPGCALKPSRMQIRQERVDRWRMVAGRAPNRVSYTHHADTDVPAAQGLLSIVSLIHVT